MWLTFYGAVFLGILFLYVPGYLWIKTFRVSSFYSLLYAPVVSLILFSFLAIAYDVAGYPASWATIVLPTVAVGAVLLAISYVLSRNSRKTVTGHSENHNLLFTSPYYKLTPRDIGLLVGYFVFALVITTLVFVYALDGPESFTQSYDDIAHLGYIQSFLDAQSYSSLSVASNLDIYPDIQRYYPAGWHLLGAVLADCLGVSNLLASNVLGVLFAGVVFPMGCLLLLRTLFNDHNDHKKVLVCGAIICLSFVAFPWFFLIYGKLSSNLAAFAYIPAIWATFMLIFAKPASLANGIKMIVLFLVGAALSVFTQPNAIFSLLAILIPYGYYLLWAKDSVVRPLLTNTAKQIVATIVLTAICVLIWWGSFNAPFLHDVVSFFWGASATPTQAIADVILFQSSYTPAQFISTFLVIVGMVYLISHKKHVWLIGSIAFLGILYVIAAAEDGPMKAIFTGFWYTDKFRLSALIAIAAIPVASYGVAALWKALLKFLEHTRFSSKTSQFRTSVVLGFFLALILFCPSFLVRYNYYIETPFGSFMTRAEEMYSTSLEAILLDPEEREFVAKVKEITGDALVMNTPYDGSVYAYQAEHLRALYRSIYSKVDESEEGQDFKLIEEQLYDLANNEAVQNAVRNIGIEYVLQLDQGHEPWPWEEGSEISVYNSIWLDSGREDHYFTAGIDQITDDTPGFELILSDGDMRLYRIVLPE